MSAHKYSLESYNDFLEALPSMNVVGMNTIKNLRTVPRILALSPSNLDDIRKINADEVLEILSNQNDDISSATVQSYKSRIQQAQKLFELYTDNPLGFTQENVMKQTQQRSLRRTKGVMHVRQEDSSTFTLPVPLRSELTLMIENFPRDLTKEEAERICTIVKAYAVNDHNDLI